MCSPSQEGTRDHLVNLFVLVCLSDLKIRYTTLLLLVACCASGAVGNQIVQEDHVKHNHEHNANMFLGSEVSSSPWFFITVI